MRRVTAAFRRYWWNLSLRRKGLIVIAIPVIALFVFSAAFLVVERQYGVAGRWLRNALDFYGSLQRVRTAVLEEDNALERYGLTTNPDDLRAYRGAVGREDKLLSQLRSSAVSNLGPTNHVEVLAQIFVKRHRLAEDFIRATDESIDKDPAGATRHWLGQNREAADEVDAQLADLLQLIEPVVRADSAALTRSVWRSNATVLASVIVGLIGGIIAMILFATGIVQRIAGLQKDANDLVNGETISPREPSADEIGHLTEALYTAVELLAGRKAESEQRAKELAASEADNQNQARLLQCILDSMAEGVLVADRTGKLVLSNPAAQKLFELDPVATGPDDWSKTAEIYLSDSLTPCPVEELPIVRAISGENPETTGLYLQHRESGHGVWIDATARPLREADGSVSGAVSVFRDVSDSRHIEDTLRMSRAEAEQANQAKSEFLSRMSHELRTPMNAILGFAQLLDLDDLNPPQRQSVDQILRGGRHLLGLINEVLDLARIEAGKMTLSNEPIPAGEAVQSSIDLVQPLASQREVTLHLAPSPNWSRHIMADRQRFQQVILNLLSNAIKYNRRNGRVTVRCRVKDETFHLAVEDTGMGLTPAKMQNLFEPFERLGADNSGVEGTGIGLALSQRLMNAMGGTIRATSEPGKGSTFRLELPVCDGPVQAYESIEGERAHASHSQSSGEKCLRVLYIEDNLSNSLLMQRILENRPEVELITAMQASLGLELARVRNPDLIFLDLHLPDLAGDEVLRILRNQPATAETPVAMISADATATQVQRLLAAGANEYFTKPLDVKRLLNYIDDTLMAGV